MKLVFTRVCSRDGSFITIKRIKSVSFDWMKTKKGSNSMYHVIVMWSVITLSEKTSTNIKTMNASGRFPLEKKWKKNITTVYV